MENQFKENDHILLWTENDILFAELKPINIDLPAAVEIMKSMETKIAGQEIQLLLYDVSKLKWIDKKSRDYIAKHPLNKCIKGWAYISGYSIHKVFYTLFITFSKPEVTTNFLRKREEGIEWLKSLP